VNSNALQRFNTAFKLDIPEEYQFTVDQHDYPYLTKEVPYQSRRGTGHVRALGRYYIDNGQCYPELTSYLRQIIESFSDVRNQPVTLQLINYLGGGTGSAAVPLLIGLMLDIGRESGCKFNVRCVGLAPILKKENRNIIPNRHISNTIVCLQEYQPLVRNLTEKSAYPIELPLYSEEERVFTFMNPPLDTFVILLVKRTEDGLQYPPRAGQLIQNLLETALKTSDSVAIGPDNLRAEGDYYESLLSQQEHGLNLDSVGCLPKSIQQNSNAYPELFEIT